jgi:hypothetical protein
VNISNIVVSHANWRYGSIISGIPGHPIEDVQISNVRFVQQGGGTKEETVLEPPEREDAYPDPHMFGTIPAYGFFVRHMKNLEVHHAIISYEKDEQRPFATLVDVDGVDFDHLNAKHADGVSMFSFRGVKDFSIHNSKGIADTHRENIEQDSL